MEKVMTQDGTPVRDEPRAEREPGTPDPTFTALAEVREQAIELLTRLDRPPRNLRIEAGPVTVDIAWPDDDPAPAAPAAAAGGASAPAAGPAAGPAEEAETDAVHLTSPAVGVFYHAREPGAEPFVSVGGAVHPGQQIGIVEAMKLMIPVEADRTGTITAVVKGDGEPVEYGEPLFALDAGPAAGEE